MREEHEHHHNAGGAPCAPWPAARAGTESHPKDGASHGHHPKSSPSGDIPTAGLRPAGPPVHHAAGSGRPGPPGKKIEVRDSKTGEDLTRAILTQILLERHPEKMEMFPVAMLHGILQANDMVLEFFRTYLRQSLAILEQMQQPAPLAPFLAPMDWMRAMMPPTLPFPLPRRSFAGATKI